MPGFLFSTENSGPAPIPPEFSGCSPELNCRCCGSKEWKPKANYLCSYFWTNPTQAHGSPTSRTDRRTTYCSNTA